LCLTNGEFYPREINPKFGSNFAMPVVYYGQLISVAYDRRIEDSVLTDILVKARKLEEIAAK
jgi:heterodisulfide reductase subunit B